MTRKQRIKELLEQKQSFARDRELRDLQNHFILKAQINPRLFDNLFKRLSKRRTPITEKRQDE